MAANAGKALKGLTPQLKGVATKVLSFLKKNPQLTQQALQLVSDTASAKGGNVGSAAALVAQQAQQLHAKQFPLDKPEKSSRQSQNEKCVMCKALRRRKKAGTITEEEKKIIDELCNACLEFCILAEQNDDIANMTLCELVKELA